MSNRSVAPHERLQDELFPLQTNIDEALEDLPTEDLPAGEVAHGCYDGWVFIGYVVEDEQGEPVENVDCVPCRRCHG